MIKAGLDQQDALGARVAALELLIEGLVLQCAQSSRHPKAFLGEVLGRNAALAVQRTNAPPQTVEVISDILARMMKRLEYRK